MARGLPAGFKLSAPLKPGEGKRGEDGYLGYLLRQAAGAYRQRMETTLADLGLTQPQFVVLTLVNAYPGLSGADLARIALLTPQTLSVILANLEKAGSIQRQPHAHNERIKPVALTPAGQSIHKTARERIRKLEETLTDGFTQEEEHAIRHWLVSVAKPA